MNLKYYIILVSILNLSCKPKIENYCYPSLEKIKEQKIDTLKLNEFKNYNQFLNKLENLNFKGSGYGFLLLKKGNKVFNLMVTTKHGFCFNSRITKRKNLITVSENCIIKNEKLFHLNSFGKILKKDLENNGRETSFAESSHKLKISLALQKSENFINLEKYLIYLIEEFNKLNTEKEFELNIQLDRNFHHFQKYPF